MELLIDELTAGYLKLDAAKECEDLMCKYCYYYMSGSDDGMLDIWAEDAENIKVQYPWGIYLGREGVKRLFSHDFAPKSDIARRRGVMNLPLCDTSVIEVADDCLTARGAFISQAVETVPVNGKAQSSWEWNKFGADFILENGKWKLWHLRVYRYFKSKYSEDWSTVDPKDVDAGCEELYTPDIPTSDRGYVYSPNAMYPADEPLPPLPYKTFGEVAPGY